MQITTPLASKQLHPIKFTKTGELNEYNTNNVAPKSSQSIWVFRGPEGIRPFTSKTLRSMATPFRQRTPTEISFWTLNGTGSVTLGGTLDANSQLIQFGNSSGSTVNRLQLGNSQNLQPYYDGSTGT